jgi:CheY-like chemotaxis protein
LSCFRVGSRLGIGEAKLTLAEVARTPREREVSMTPDMAFECVLVSRDPNVVCVLNPVLDNLSISVKLCLSPAKALNVLTEGSTDLVVIDWEEDLSASELLNEIQRRDLAPKQTVVAVSTSDRIPGADLVLRKPITPESGAESLKRVYSRLLQDHRRHARYALMTPVIATASDNRLLAVTITNIGDGGIGLRTRERVTIGDVLSFPLSFPTARRAIYIEARILWTRDYGTAGCEFLRIPPLDLDILHDWLKAKCRIKKPLI